MATGLSICGSAATSSMRKPGVSLKCLIASWGDSGLLRGGFLGPSANKSHGGVGVNDMLNKGSNTMIFITFMIDLVCRKEPEALELFAPRDVRPCAKDS